MIKAKNSNNEYVNIEDIKYVKSGETKDIEYIKDNLGNVLYSKYKEIETETLPVNFISKNNTLKNYRIYGNTVNGDSVGEKTANLFDFRKWSINVAVNNGNNIIKNIDSVTLIANTNDTFTAPYAYSHTDLYKINVNPNTTYVLSWSSNNNLSGRVFVFKNGVIDSTHMINVDNSKKKYLLLDTDTDTEFVTLRFGVTNAGDSITYSKIMFVEGDAALPYEPYGYKISVVVNEQITNIYLDEPLRKIGTYTDYADYENQKVIRKVVRKVFDGTETFISYSTNIIDYIVPTITMGGPATVNCTSNHISVLSADEGGSNRNAPNAQYISAFYQSSSSKIRFVWNDNNGVTNLSDLKAQLSTWYANGNPLIVDCIIETSVEEQVTLPDIPTFSDTNTLTIGTEIQPSKVYLKGKIKRN